VFFSVKLGLTIGVHETIGDLRTMLSKDTGIERSQILLTEIDDLTFRRTFKDSELVTVINDKASDTCSLYCVEVLKHREATEDDGAYVLLTWVNVLKEGPIEKRFGSPYTIQVSRETLYTDLQKLLMKEMACILHDDILISNQKVPLFNIRILDGLKGNNYLDSNVDLPMYTLAIEQAVNLCSVDEIVPHVKLTLEWDAPAKSQIISDDRDVIEEHASVKQVAKSPEEATSVTLQECFSLYTKAEKLGDTNAWFCPECKRKQEVVKRMGLWSLPDVLIIHLKRFRQTDNASNKLSTLVEFPLEGCDMSPFVTTRNEQPLEQPPAQQPPMEQPVHNVWSNVLSSFKKDKSTAPEQSPVQPQKACFVYDLYAVCNHHGDDLQGGHYTATCRNPTDGQWYAFDDVNTSKVEEPEVVTDDAYILFYQRQSTTPNSSSASSSASSSSSSAQEHWVYRMPDFNYKGKNGMPLTKSQQQQANIKAATSGFSRNTGKYATMPTSTTTAVKAADESTTAETTADKCDKEQPHSDGEEPREEEELCSDQELPPAQEEVVKEEQEGKSSTTKAEAGTEAATEDVSRPIDKNDVD
jgi:ubiquitin carboxyl-terminal hydrolase 31